MYSDLLRTGALSETYYLFNETPVQ